MVRIDSEQSFNLLRKNVWPGSVDDEEKSIVVKIVPDQQVGQLREGFTAEEYFRSELDTKLLDAEVRDVLATVNGEEDANQ